jgi:hypothetical protein
MVATPVQRAEPLDGSGTERRDRPFPRRGARPTIIGAAEKEHMVERGE